MTGTPLAGAGEEIAATNEVLTAMGGPHLPSSTSEVATVGLRLTLLPSPPP